MTKDEAKAIIEREPVGGAHYYNKRTELFYSEFNGSIYVFIDEWVMSITWVFNELEELTPMHEILAIALGDEK